MSIVVIDLDEFKAINDSFRRDIGHQMLRYVGQVMLKAFRNKDLICRYGDDEFVGALVQIDLEAVINVRTLVIVIKGCLY